MVGRLAIRVRNNCSPDSGGVGDNHSSRPSSARLPHIAQPHIEAGHYRGQYVACVRDYSRCLRPCSGDGRVVAIDSLVSDRHEGYKRCGPIVGSRAPFVALAGWTWICAYVVAHNVAPVTVSLHVGRVADLDGVVHCCHAADGFAVADCCVIGVSGCLSTRIVSPAVPDGVIGSECDIGGQHSRAVDHGYHRHRSGDVGRRR